MEKSKTQFFAVSFKRSTYDISATLEEWNRTNSSKLQEYTIHQPLLTDTGSIFVLITGRMYID